MTAEPPQAVRAALIMPNVFLVLDDLVRRAFAASEVARTAFC
jgi:hypothetical protein